MEVTYEEIIMYFVSVGQRFSWPDAIAARAGIISGEKNQGELSAGYILLGQGLQAYY